jgi:hypothetical protein
MPKPGDVIDNYLLNEKLGSLGCYIETWRATDEQGVGVVIKHHYTAVMDDHGGYVSDLTKKVAELLPQIERLTTLPARPGLAPWVRYHFDPAHQRLLLCRPYYDDCLEQRVPIARTPDLLERLGELAQAIDFLQQHNLGSLNLVPGNLFIAGGQAYLGDYGLLELHKLIESSYSGPRPFVGGVNYLLGRDMQRVQRGNVFDLALLYYYLRTGRIAFGNFVCDSPTNFYAVLAKFYEGQQRYEEIGELCLDALPELVERQIVARALAKDSSQRFSTCAQLVASLASGQ